MSIFVDRESEKKAVFGLDQSLDASFKILRNYLSFRRDIMVFVELVAALIFTLLSLLPSARAQSLSSLISQKAYEFSRGDACYKDPSGKPASDAKATCANCQNLAPCPTEAMAELNESLFFDQAAREYLGRTKCWEQKVESLDAPKKQALLSDLKLQLPMVIDLYKQLEKLKHDKMDYIKTYDPRGDDKNHRIADFNLALKEVSSQLNVALSSTWFGGHFIGKKALMDWAVKASENPEKYIEQLQVQDLDRELLNPIRTTAQREQFALFRKSRPGIGLQKKVLSDRTRIMTPNLPVLVNGKVVQKQRTNGISQAEMDRDLSKMDPTRMQFDLDDEQKIKLFREIGLGDFLLKRTPEDFKRNANLICQLNGRYGKTRETYDNILGGLEFVASMAIPMGPYVASAKGLISARTAWVLSTAASVGMGLQSIQKDCGESAINYKVSPGCNSQKTSEKDFVDELSQNNCLMGVGLSAASFVSPLAAKAFGKLKAKVHSVPESVPTPEPLAQKPSSLPAEKAPEPVSVPVASTEAASEAAPKPAAATVAEKVEVAPATSAPAALAGPAPKLPNGPSSKIAVEKDSQSELWKLRESGDLKKAKAYEEKILKKMKSQKMKDLGPVGGDNNSGSHFVELEDGTKGIWKPLEKTGQLEEVAAHEVDGILGLNYVPMTVPKSLNSKQGTFQLLKGNIESAENTSHPDHLLMFDYLISNYDRHGRNYLLAEGRRVVAIDHSSAFSGLLHPKNFKQTSDLLLSKVEEAKKTGKATVAYVNEAGQKVEKTMSEAELRSEAKSLYSTMTVNKSVYEKLKQTSESQWKQRLQGKLTEAQIESLLARREEIIQSVERAKRVFGNDVLAEGSYSPLLRPTLTAPDRP